MDLGKWIKNRVKDTTQITGGAIAQVNPLDGGKTFSDYAGETPHVKAYNTLQRANTGIREFLNPFDSESKGNKLVNDTARRYGATEEFKNTIGETNPYVSGGLQKSDGLTEESNAAGWYKPYIGPNKQLNSRMWMSEKLGNNAEDVMHHEGLHASWDKSPNEDRMKYLDMIQANLEQVSDKPTVRGWLTSRVDGYKANDGNLQDFRTMDPRMQTEIHSYIPEYYAKFGETMPDELASYYSKFYDTNRPKQRYDTVEALSQLIDGRFRGQE